uniref:Uncharacterized protein n=1 Tax=Candidozyma auris TaxID=498019 RepID=A0A0L0NQM3_CANAR
MLIDFSTEIMLNFNSKEYYRVLVLLVNCYPEELTALAKAASAIALVRLGRLRGAVHFLIQAIEAAPNPSDRKLYMFVLKTILEDNGRRSPKFLKIVNDTIATDEDRKIIGSWMGYFYNLPPPQPLLAQVQRYETAGGLITPNSFCAAVKRDTSNTRLVDEKTLPYRIFDLIEEFGPWDVTNSLIKSHYNHNTKIRRLIELSSSLLTLEEDMTGALDFSAISCVRATLAMIYFLKHDYQKACLWCDEYFSLSDHLRLVLSPDNMSGVATKDIVTVLMIMTNCIELGILADIPLLETLLSRLLDPKTSMIELRREENSTDGESITDLGSSDLCERHVWNSLSTQEESPHVLSFSMRKSQFFSCCGHLHRQIAAKKATPVNISIDCEKQLLGKCYDFNECIETARLYILAAACHPLDDPLLYRMYDRVIWALCLAGGIHTRVVSMFLTARNKAQYAATFVPAIREQPFDNKTYLVGHSPGMPHRPKLAPLSSFSSRSYSFVNLHRLQGRPVSLAEPCGPYRPQAVIRRGNSKKNQSNWFSDNKHDSVFSGAVISPWPDFKDLHETLYEMYQFITMTHRFARNKLIFDDLDPVFLSPSVFEHNLGNEGTTIFLANQYFPGVKKFKASSGLFIEPELRPRIKLLPEIVERHFALSKDLARLWGTSYLQHHSDIPWWATDVLTWAGMDLGIFRR